MGSNRKKQIAGSSDRSSKETRKSILKAIIRDGFGGELQAELEKDVVKKKRFNVSKLHTETVPAQHNTRHKANGRQTDGR